MIEKIILKKSAVLDKMPTADQLDFGELAINYNAEHPFLSFKDSDGDIMPLNDYSQDIAYLFSHKLDAGVLDTINQNTDDIKKKLNITDFNAFKADNTKTINAFAIEVAKALETKAEKTEHNAYAKLSDTGQTILANKLKADDLILAGFSLNDLLNTANNNISRNTEYISNVELQKVDKTDIVQSTGTSTTSVMSQKAVSDIIGNIEQLLNSI